MITRPWIEFNSDGALCGSLDRKTRAVQTENCRVAASSATGLSRFVFQALITWPPWIEWNSINSDAALPVLCSAHIPKNRPITSRSPPGRRVWIKSINYDNVPWALDRLEFDQLRRRSAVGHEGSDEVSAT